MLDERETIESEPPHRPRYRRMRAIFLRGLGVVYLAAFASLAVQVDGLIGSRGILPAAEFLDAVGPILGNRRYGQLPTVLWLGCSDRALHLLCWGGVAASALLVAGVLPRVCLMALWLGYLSLMAVGQPFLGYQWDTLLLEAGLLGILFAPWSLWLGWARREPSLVVVWLIRWLVFRLMFESGVVKLTSGDPTWRAWDALRVPLRDAAPADLDELVHAPAPALVPGALDWRDVLGRADRPVVRLRTATGADGRILEPGAAPGADRGDRELRVLQRALAWCSACRWWRTRTGAGSAPIPGAADPALRGWWRRIPVGVAGAVIVVVTTMQGLDRTGPTVVFPAPLEALRGWVEPFHSMNAYGLFAVMTTERPEIVVEGSDDGETWVPYVFRWKPGDVDRRPRFTTPHMPRLDWQMWFAALAGDCRSQRWFLAFEQRLLEGSPDVLGLSRADPFPTRPPRYLRAQAPPVPLHRPRREAWWQMGRGRVVLPADGAVGAFGNSTEYRESHCQPQQTEPSLLGSRSRVDPGKWEQSPPLRSLIMEIEVPQTGEEPESWQLRTEEDGLRSLRTLFRAGTCAGLADGPFLERFATRGGETSELAFAALVERHGPMVLRTCRAVLRDEHDAQDAFQATFLSWCGAVGRSGCGIRWGPGCTGSPAAPRSAPARRRAAAERRERRAAELAGRDRGRTGPGRARRACSRKRSIGCPTATASRSCSATSRAAPTRKRRSTWGAPSGRSRAAWRGAGAASEPADRRGLAPGVIAPAQRSPSGPRRPCRRHWPKPRSRPRCGFAAVKTAGAGPASAAVAALTEGVLRSMFLTNLKTAASILLAIGVTLGCLAPARVRGSAEARSAGQRPPGGQGRPSAPAQAPGDRTACRRESHPVGRRSHAWRRTDVYEAPDFERFFPDDPEGGTALDALWDAKDRDQRPDAEILRTVRQGLRHTRDARPRSSAGSAAGTSGASRPRIPTRSRSSTMRSIFRARPGRHAPLVASISASRSSSP